LPIVTVRYFAGAKAAAGTATERLEGSTVADLVDALSGRDGTLARVLTTCSFIIDGVVTRDPATSLPDGATVDVLPPFAGG
jgi:molybdopterin converting factor small subunit